MAKRGTPEEAQLVADFFRRYAETGEERPDEWPGPPDVPPIFRGRRDAAIRSCVMAKEVGHRQNEIDKGWRTVDGEWVG